MNSTPSPNADGPDDILSEEEFMEALKDPAYAAQFRNVVREVLNGRYGEVPPELREAAERSVKADATEQTLRTYQSKLVELCAVIKLPPGSFRGDERLGEDRNSWQPLEAVKGRRWIRCRFWEDEVETSGDDGIGAQRQP